MRRACLLLLAVPAVGAAAGLPPDPLDSPMWEAVAGRYLGDDAQVTFDERVEVLAPAEATDARATPVMVRAPALDGVREVVVFADLNPVTGILAYSPLRAEPGVAFRFRVHQATPVRAAMRTADGVWHVGGRWIGAQGGSCTAPGTGEVDGAPAASGSGSVSGRVWARGSGVQRVRFRVTHPMHTGLVAGVPARHITEVELSTTAGQTLARLAPEAGLAANPVISVDLRHDGPVVLSGRDSAGNRFEARLPAPSGDE